MHRHRKWHTILQLLFGMAILFAWIAMPLRAQEADKTQVESQVKPLTLAEYRTELAHAVEQLQAATEEEIDATVQTLRIHFEEIEQVQFENGEIVTLDSILGEEIAPTDTPLIEEDETWTDVRVRILARLQAAITQIDASATDNTAARLAILDEVLARSEFNTPISLWERFWQWLGKLLEKILPESRGQGGGWLLALLRILPWAITIIAVAAILWLLTYWLQRILRNFVHDARAAELEGDEDLPRTAAEARQQAHEAAQSGLYRAAVRRLYLAAILQLAENDLITYERSLTNLEVLQLIPTTSPIRPHLEPVVNTFDEVWYGIHEPDRATFNAYEQEIDALATVAKQVAAQMAASTEQNRMTEQNSIKGQAK